MQQNDQWVIIGAQKRVRALETALEYNAPMLSADEAIKQVEWVNGNKLTNQQRAQFLDGWARGGVTWGAQSLLNMLDLSERGEANQWASELWRMNVKHYAYVHNTSPKLPRIVCLCGSTRFSDAFRAANLDETLAGNIVLTIGCDMRSDAEVFAGYSEDQIAEVKKKLDELHLRKIDMADEVLILNVGGYIGESTRRELGYARSHGKTVRWLEEDKAE